MMTMKFRDKGFTLIELLIVVAIIAVLISILAPALQSAREQGKRALCLYNTHALSIAWIQYIEENKGKLPYGMGRMVGNELAANKLPWVYRLSPPHHIDPTLAPESLQFEAIRRGTLFPYTNSTSIYRCPVAKANEKRTYSITHAMNGYNFPSSGEILSKLSSIKRPEERINFLDDFGPDWDACWAVSYTLPRWWNTTPIRHGNGNTFAFGDGHSEWWKWQDERTIALAEKYYDLNYPGDPGDPESTQPDNPDLIRVTMAAWGGLGY